MARPQKPQDVYVNNGWYLNIPIEGIQSDGLFETLSGMGMQSGVVEVVDAGTNIKYKFSDQMVDFTNMTLTRSYNGSAADRAMETLVKTMIQTGLKLPVTAVKMHHGKEVLTIVFEGFSFSEANYPDFDVAGTDKFTVSYAAHCDGWTVLPVGE